MELATASSEAPWRTDLVIVSGIKVEGAGRKALGLGGVMRVVEDWTPAEDHLRPLTFD